MGAEEREEGEGRERDAEERNSRQVYDSPEDDPEVLAASGNLAGNNTAAPQSLNGTEVQLQIIQEGEERTENAGERNPRQVINGYEDVPKVLVPSGNLAGNSTAAPQSLNGTEVQLQIIQEGEERTENAGERNPRQVINGYEDVPKVLVPSGNLAGNSTAAPQSLNGTEVHLQTTQEGEERTEDAGERNPRQVINGYEDVPKVLVPSGNLAGNSTAAPQSLNGTEVHL